MAKPIIVLLLCCCCNCCLLAQTVLSGKCSSLDGTVPAGLNITVHPKHNIDSIIAYGFSDSKGSFRIVVKHSRDSLALAVKSMLYTDTLLFLANRSQNLSIVVDAKTYVLQEVTVRARPIYRKGDTTTYRVEAFAQQQDFSIGDVIKKMPGFDVSDDGKISYQGESIQKYYIEGLDLLGSGYTLANNNLPHRTVSAVEVLHHHQPIKAMEEIISSDRTSLNIKLKQGVAVTGTLRTGIGVAPLLWDINLTPMLFAKNQQIIGSWQSNNIGNDIGAQQQSVTISNGRMDGLSTLKPAYVNVPNLSAPDVARNKYLDNESNLFTYNHLIKLGQTTQLKVNGSYYRDNIRQERVMNTAYYLPDSVMSIHEEQQNSLFRSSLILNLNLEQNVKSRYLNNKLSFGQFWDSDDALIRNSHDNSIEAKTPHTTLANSFDVLIPVKKNFLRVESLVHLNNTPQELFFLPAVFLAGDNTTQQVHNRNAKTANKLSFSLPLRKVFVLSTSVGLDYEPQEHKTKILSNGVWNGADSLNNFLQWNRTKFEVKEELQYKKGKLTVRLTAPVEYILLNIDDNVRHTANDLNRWFFSPSFSIRYTPVGNIDGYVGAHYSEVLGNVNNMLQGNVIGSHRLMSSNQSEIDITQSKSIYAGLKYQNPTAGLFIDLNWNMSFGLNNLMTNQRLQSNGLLIFETIAQENQSRLSDFSSDASWYIQSIKTTLGVKAEYTENTMEYMLNDEQGTNTMKQYALNPRILLNNLSRFFSVNYQYKIAKAHTNSGTDILEQKHKCDVYVYPHNSHFAGIEIELYNTKQTTKSDNQSLFANVVYSYKPPKYRFSLRFECRNIFNAQKLTEMQKSDIAMFQTEYYLRPRQFLLTLTWSLGRRK